MRGWWLALLLAVPQAAAEPQLEASVSCSSISPLDNQCSAGHIQVSPWMSAEFEVLGFIGRLTVEARQDWPFPPFFGVLRWRCDAVGSALMATCYEVEKQGLVVPLFPAEVTCTASGLPGSLLPPLGPWTCRVTNDPPPQA